MVTQYNPDDVVLDAVGLTKIYKDFWGRPKARAVNGIDLKIRRGQVFGLLGPNGSGKSTTVKMCLGLLYPSRGSLQVLGESPRSVAVKRRIGYLPEESYLYRYLTAFETLDFFGALFGLPAEERTRRCQQLLDMVGLGNARYRPVGEFSKGMARRVGIAQALINDPDLVILDEPTSGLDPIGCREVKDLIRLLANRGKTVILCSHLLADVEDVCDEVVVLYGGKVQARGPLKELLTIEDKTRITVPGLDKTILDKVLAILNEGAGTGQVAVDHPSMDLETFFLEVVRKAQAASADTAGARAGGRVAAYLLGSEQAAAPVSLEALVDQPAAPTADVPLTVRPAPAAAELDSGKLAQLADEVPPAPAVSATGRGQPETAVPPVVKPTATRDALNQRLKSLSD
jgi:ABC-2 type transport system ATP-binding protein